MGGESRKSNRGGGAWSWSFVRTALASILVAAVLGAIAGNAVSQDPAGFKGTDRGDVEEGSSEADAANGAGGDDLLRGMGGADDLDGGDGDDIMVGDEGTDTSCCADVMSGDAGDDHVYGGGGGDVLAGGPGADKIGSRDLTRAGGVLVEEHGADTIDAGAGDDSVQAGPGSDVITPGDGHDVVVGDQGGSASTDTIVEADTIYEGPGSDSIDGGGGADTVNYGNLAEPVHLVPGEVAAESGSQPASRIATEGENEDRMVRVETITGTNIPGEGDELVGVGAFGTLSSTGVETLNGLEGPDVLDGRAGKDVLNGGLGDDTMLPGSPGAPVCSQQIGGGEVCTTSPDVVNGGMGIDTVSFENSPNPITASLATGTASGDGNDQITAVEDIIGSPQDDQLTGSSERNEIVGGGGTDRLAGGDHSDTLDVQDGAGGDSVSCGAGIGDVAKVDPGDTVLDGCEMVQDGIAPGAPSALTMSPASPSNSARPAVRGSLGGGDPATVRIYVNGNCAGSPAEVYSVSSGTPEEFTGEGISVSVPENASSQISAVAADQGGDESTCSPVITYTHDSLPPGSPTLSSTFPASPANNNAPKVRGSAAPGATVRLYKTADCSGLPVATGSAAQLVSPGIAATVANNSVTSFRATATDAAGNVSGCSAPRIYVEDSLAPPAPALSGTAPASPANNNAPKVIGSAQARTTIQLFKSADCSGAPVASGTAAQLADPGIGVKVPNNSKTIFKATATDAAANRSGCSAGRKYVERTPRKRRGG